MIDQTTYQDYFQGLLRGDRGLCQTTVKDLLSRGLPVKEIYTGLFQRSLYQVGELWEHNHISVATEHLATSITESLLSLMYSQLFENHRCGRRVVMACTANEYHQLGAKIVADLLELNGWDSFFVGANTPVRDLLNLLSEKKPDALALSLAVYANLGNLVLALNEVRQAHPELPVMVGGQAFRWGGREITRRWSDVTYLADLDQMEAYLGERFGLQPGSC